MNRKYINKKNIQLRTKTFKCSKNWELKCWEIITKHSDLFLSFFFLMGWQSSDLFLFAEAVKAGAEEVGEALAEP